jgi:hypothetical protein
MVAHGRWLGECAEGEAQRHRFDGAAVAQMIAKASERSSCEALSFPRGTPYAQNCA